ncbi:MAG: hypothetical protein OEV95_06295, partial [Gemmatimonadota bacterium]|nr:hypothetical protein [Gemmatimonadota bacterium]
IKRYVGLDLLDLVIHAGVTIALAVAFAEWTVPQEEVGVGLVFAVSFVVLALRRARALRHQAEGGEEPEASRRIEELEDRLAELEAGQGRVLELEERLDFAERMLARESERARLPQGQTGL